MHGSRPLVTTYFLVVAMVVVALGGVLASPANAGDIRVVRLELRQASNGSPIIMVNPPHAKIWREAPGKAHMIRWWMEKNRTSFDEIFWEFRYDPTKKGATADYFGEVDLECGKTRVDALPEMKPDSPNAEWPYTVTAYACHEGKKAQKISSVDARIVWKN